MELRTFARSVVTGAHVRSLGALRIGNVYCLSSITCIMPLSSCLTTWQWNTNRPTISGFVKRVIILASPGFPQSSWQILYSDVYRASIRFTRGAKLQVALLDSLEHGSGAIAHAKLRKNIGDVIFDGSFG